MMEVTYLNTAPFEVDGKRKRIADMFRHIQLPRPVNMFNFQWAESLDKDNIPGQPFRGVINAMVAIGQVPPAISVLGFNFNGLGAVADGQESKHILNEIHARIREIYQSAITSDDH